jgi:hypothetical protein
MKHAVKLTFGLLVLCALALTSAPAQAATGAGAYYAWPAWDQTLQCDTQATCPRFIVLTNMGSAAVLDRETGLVWEKSPDLAARTWSFARGVCLNKSVGGRNGWRLPSVQEPASLVDPSVSPGPKLPAGHPFTNVQSSHYWSATTDADVPAAAWEVLFNIGVVNSVVRGDANHVWCVRGGGVLDNY